MSFERVASERYDTIPDIPEPVEHGHLFGHSNEAEDLAHAYRAGKFHHALVLSGPRGIGKATLAFRLAYHILAHPDPASASERLTEVDTGSTLFRLMAQGAHPSLIHLTRPVAERGSGFKSAVTVDEVRRVGRFLSMTSHDGGYRVVIVDAADDMNRNAANALLKSLEEPPPRTLFVLIVHSIGRMLPTIRSRCQLVKLKPLDQHDIVRALRAISPGTDSSDSLIQRAGGSVRDALLMTHFGGLDIADAVDAMMSASRFDVAAAYRIADAVGGRDATVQFQLFNEHVASIAEARARSFGEAGEVETAARLAADWASIRQQMRDTDTYNLDKRQHVVSLLGSLCGAR
ncbi:DNA polymerase III subunit delta' [Aliihoeflea aestuarii]|jgi:DNA polymerase III subunit delta'|uniref:DNA polymerase III subunit delta' n=1 Tax=Aliihoeflea aestuarii TaxID=453840 RepID=UPI00209281E1|nr:DNA polymerase III subunit delta' [Aliihoeflea aestuarii]MCO6390398.1 DNA polymerase III subunit delta' [Aliihoeflea aestuarii]